MGETALLDCEGAEVPVLQIILAHKNVEGSVEFFSTTARDITDRKRSEEELRERDAMFRQIAENIREMLWIFDLKQGRPVYVSPAYERICGSPVESVFENPQGFLRSVSPSDQIATSDAVDKSNADESGTLEFLFRRPDQSIRWLRGRAFPIHDGQGSVDRLVGITEDVTERKQLEEELCRSQRLEAIGHLAAGVAHEINTPIQYVGDNLRFLEEGFSGLSELLAAHRRVLEEGHVPGSVREELARTADELDMEYLLAEVPQALHQGLEGIERIAEIVRAMKEFSHPGTQEKTPTDINRAIESTLTVARNEWKYVAEVITDLDADLPLVPCLPGDFNQAILNLIVNAAHAVGSVVGDGSGGRGTIRISTRREGDWAEVRITDSGTGIPEEARSRIFDPFFTTKEVGRGTGQGLTLAHTVVVEKHGGSLSFETELGKGTTFLLRLPLVASSGEQVHPNMPPASQRVPAP
jgi:PAS domain S-box-containing protein